MTSLQHRIVAKYSATALISVGYLTSVLARIDQGNAPDAYRILQSLGRSLSSGNVDPFPVSELPEYLRGRGVPEDEVQLVATVKAPRAPKEKPKGPSFTDAFLEFGRQTQTSVVPDMKFESSPVAGESTLSWLAGFRKLQPQAKKLWEKAVKKVHLGNPSGSEDASWRPGGVLFLDVTRKASPASRKSQLTHELGHAFEELHSLGHQPPWGEPPFVSDYAEMKPLIEDIAESFRAFVEEPRLLKARCPEKYALLLHLV